MIKTSLLLALFGASFVAVSSTHTEARVPSAKFTFKDGSGKAQSVDVVDHFQPKKLTQPVAKSDGIDPKLTRAATIAQERANAHSRRMCWAYVKDALLASGAVSSRPETLNAKEAAGELVSRYGFKKLPVTNPYSAPVGAVLVYTAKGAPGHVEIRTNEGFVSDFRSKTPSSRPLIGVFAKS
ncbi:MAG: hypothetical protein ACJ8KU_10015 [Chthoniobacterales bacterium]